MGRPILKGFSFRNKLIVSFLLVSLLPVLMVQMISYYVSAGAMEKKIDNLVQANLLQTSKNLDTSLNAYADILFQIFTDDDVMELTKEINNPRTESPELSRRKLINILSSYSYAKEGIRSVAIFTSNGTLICYDQQTGTPYENLWSGVSDLTSLSVYQEAMAHKSGDLITPPAQIDSIYSKGQYGFHIARKLSDLNGASLEGIGVAVITVYESVLADAINLAASDPAGTDRLDNRNFLTDNEDRIVSSPDNGQMGMNISDVTGKSTISNTFYNERSGLTINNLIDQNELFKEMYSMQRLSLYAGIAALVLSGILIYYFSGSLTRSIRTVVRAMKVAQQGILNVKVDSETRDEISAIAFSFNKMMNTVNELMNETKMAVEKRKEAEIRALEAQINPHFLYNTLDSINWLAIEKDEHQISQMLKGLAQILRYSVKDSNKWVALQEELEWMNSYIYLQQHRFRSSFRFEVELDERALGYRVHKLLFQPFIENSIIHGFAGRKQGGILRISVIVLDERFFEVRIEDNGTGMTEEKLAEILSERQKHENSLTGGGLGIRNVFDRVHMYYGPKANWELESILGEGTSIRIVLPIQGEGEVAS
ncbi:cache domain-containing sensor histidine kinase [Cohnella lupini]|uniref:histidine kinase n=1 Tax=Cohnella lupini TaxID=1294267 RepID=A0A3D9IT43_9BACL|nr:sensor histidine kinase [Cohnella lupini]RED64817.1 two-component system sensor histidine kinase YesM [Cohnella lupini]